MKTSLILLLIPVLCLFGCSNDTSEQEGAPNVEQDIGSMADDCCGAIYYEWVDGTAPAGGTHLWLALEYQGQAVAYGDPVFVEGSYDTVLRVSSGYLDGLPDNLLFKRVYSTPDARDVGNTSKSIIAREAFPVEADIGSKGNCTACCTKGLRRYYARAILDRGNLVGAKAKIETCWGQLCPADTVESQSGAWVGLQQHRPPAQRTNFVQAGYMHKRWSSTNIDTEPFRACRRQNYVRDYCHGKTKQVFTGGPGTGRADG